MLYVVPLLIIIAWVLVAIPGSYVGGVSSLREDRVHYNHGWPLVHLESTTVEVSGVWDRGKLLPHKSLTDEQYVELAAKRAEARADDLESDPTMLNLYPRVVDGKSLGEFWNIDNWPISSPQRKSSINIPGLAGNIIILGLVLFGVTAMIKRCTR